MVSTHNSSKNLDLTWIFELGTKKSGKMGASGVGFNPMGSMLGGTSMGGTMNHQSTVPMNFRG